MDTGRSFENDIGHLYADDLRDSRPRVVEHRQQQMVALRGPRFPGLP